MRQQYLPSRLRLARCEPQFPEVADLAEISEVYSVSGNFDLVTIIRVKDNDDLAKLVTERLARVAGITHTHTMLAFRAYSRHDLEGMFAVGQED